MKKIFFIAFVLISSFIGSAQKGNYMTFEAEIANRFGDAISFYNTKGILVKTIPVDKNGFFKDTMNVITGRYALSDGNDYTVVFLKNDLDLKLKMDAKKFDQSIIYSGIGAIENNFLAQNALLEKQTNIKTLMLANEADFLNFMDKKKTADLKRLDNEKLDPVFVDIQKKSMDEEYALIVQYYKKNHDAIVAKNKLNNKTSPAFDYVNHKGGNTKLSDFKGKYVYIDIWATWCGPCRAEIPSLKKVEEKYHDKNIVFVSISIDAQKDLERWKNFVTDKKLGGVQLIADKDWNSDFVRGFGIQSIPRFILIDPDGKILQSDAARPSTPELRRDLDKLLN